jgi:hypothetical protein
MTDQKYRDIEKIGYLYENEQEQKKLDSLNQHIVDSIITKYGILSYKQIGLIAYKGQMAVLTHAGQLFKEKYLTTVKEAFRAKDIFTTHYILFVDKYLTQKNKLQIFGTQYIKYKGKIVPYPFDLNQINIYRAGVGLDNIFTTKTTLLNTGIIDSTNCTKLFPEIIQHFKIDTVNDDYFSNFK